MKHVWDRKNKIEKGGEYVEWAVEYFYSIPVQVTALVWGKTNCNKKLENMNKNRRTATGTVAK